MNALSVPLWTAGVLGVGAYLYMMTKGKGKAMVPMVKGDRDAALVLALEAVADYALRLEAKIVDMQNVYVAESKRYVEREAVLYEQAGEIRALKSDVERLEHALAAFTAQPKEGPPKKAARRG